MRVLISFSLLIFLVATCTGSASENQDSCVELNSRLSVCDVENVAVSFVDGTDTAVMGIARLGGSDGLKYVFHVSWDVESSLETYAKAHARGTAQEAPSDFELQSPVTTVVEGFTAIRYDLLPSGGAGPSAQPQLLLFIDTGAGIATIFSGTLNHSGVTLDDLYAGAKSAARILRID